MPDIPIQAAITDKDIIGEPKMGVADGLGNEKGAYFLHNNKHIGKFDSDYKDLIKLAETIQGQKDIGGKVTVKFVTDSIFEWIKDKYKGKANTDLVPYIIEKVQDRVKKTEVLIPLANTHIQSEITIGRVKISSPDSTLKCNTRAKDLRWG
jgi:hypothetical protein